MIELIVVDEWFRVRLDDRLPCRMLVLADADGPGGAIETVYYQSYLDA